MANVQLAVFLEIKPRPIGDGVKSVQQERTPARECDHASAHDFNMRDAAFGFLCGRL